MKQELICITCPMGCPLTVETDNGEVLSVSGNTCPRGEIYAKNEIINPLRVVTSTVKTTNGKLLSVKTDKAIPKNLMNKCMEIINSLHPKSNKDLTVGTVLCKNVLGTDANIVLTAPVRISQNSVNGGENL